MANLQARSFNIKKNMKGGPTISVGRLPIENDLDLKNTYKIAKNINVYNRMELHFLLLHSLSKF